ncbi:cyclic nucleotide-gated cation channel subunit A-like [Oppia nitens]|uniref:cyclic nucleotide-gated cation channel subunit A-like n=1 Tax=Oppia nitens TaxID=1686743 RepID=UPI0023DC90C3|nr:cyclic nucleotide-gated cation channel subunit A-like [Oppia nitens]XP_054163637.1 cyclic nucleotide-gated cation channel subunit A-like [Oppia nitens]
MRKWRPSRSVASSDSSAAAVTADAFLDPFVGSIGSSPKDRSFLVIDPSGHLHYRWLFLVSLAVLYNLVFIIARSTFADLQNAFRLHFLVLDIVCDSLFAIDSVLSARTAFLDSGLPVRDSRRLFSHYMSSSAFRLDVFSLLPTDVVLFVSHLECNPTILFPCVPIVRLNRLFRFYRFREFFERTETRTQFPNALRVAKLVLYIVVLIHWNACAYFAISFWIGFDSDRWVYNRRSSSADSLSKRFVQQYVYCFYWSTLTLTTIGEVPPPETDAEYAFVVLNFLIGVLIFATIVGNVGSMISNMNAARADFQARMDAVKQYMEFRHVTKPLETRVIRWFDYLWTNKQSLDESAVTAVLPDQLKAEIAIHAHLQTLRRVRLFQDCEPGLLVQLVLKLRLQVFSPGDFICRKGDVGKEMYIVKRGRLAVVADDGITSLANLTDGATFGELAILNISGVRTGNRRTANVRSVGYSDLFCLSKQDLWDVLEDYPEARAALVERGKQILRKDGLLDDSALLRHELEQQDTRAAVSRLEVSVDQLQTRLARLLAEFASSQKRLKQRIAALESRADSD